MQAMSAIIEKLEAARERYARALQAYSSQHQGGEIEEFREVQAEKIALEREYSLANGWETALKIDWVPKWDIGAPCPHVISAEGRVFLLYWMNEDDPQWDGKYVNIDDSKSEQAQPIALVEFKRCYVYKFGGMNDEVWSGHPLYERGLEGYRAHQIENSQWLKDEKKINSVHRGCYKEEHWLTKKHYFLLFHDDMFECLADGYSIEVYRDSFKNVMRVAAERLFWGVRNIVSDCMLILSNNFFLMFLLLLLPDRR